MHYYYMSKDAWSFPFQFDDAYNHQTQFGIYTSSLNITEEADDIFTVSLSPRTYLNISLRDGQICYTNGQGYCEIAIFDIHQMIPFIVIKSNGGGQITFTYTPHGGTQKSITIPSTAGTYCYGNNGTNSTNIQYAFEELDQFEVTGGGSYITELSLPYLRPLSTTGYWTPLSGLTSLTNLGFICGEVGVNCLPIFRHATALQTLDLRAYDMSKTSYIPWTNTTQGDGGGMYYMFQGMTSLKNLYLGVQNLSNIHSMREMCSNCTSLISIDLSGITTQDLTATYQTFYRCTSLQTAQFSSKFKMNNVRIMSYMFYNCPELTSITNFNLDMSSVTSQNSANAMFLYCYTLNTITGTWSNIKWSLSFYSSPLSRNTVMNTILPGLVQGANKTLTLSTTTKNALSTSDKAQITARGWTIA